MDITTSPDFDIRYSTIHDLTVLKKWLRTKGMLHWYPPSNEEELENFAGIWLSFAKYNASLTAEFNNDPVGIGTLLLMPYRKVAHQCMFQLIVDPNYQRKGVGRALIRNLKHLAKNRFRLDLMHVEILDESPLIDLLKGQGFTEFARQEKFVKENGVYFPRILMECNL
ncbi:MAG: GNAT family N-acetyltransferase [Verrucomicrobia bacterium]|nr:GNAT family N-acetyltransferase [Verrucomicrobiota bacterium]